MDTRCSSDKLRPEIDRWLDRPQFVILWGMVSKGGRAIRVEPLTLPAGPEFSGGASESRRSISGGNAAAPGSVFAVQLRSESAGRVWLEFRDIRSLVRTETREARNMEETAAGPDALTGRRRHPLCAKLSHRAHLRWLGMKRSRPSPPRHRPELRAEEDRGLNVGLPALPNREAVAEISQPPGRAPADVWRWSERPFGPLRMWGERIVDRVFLQPSNSELIGSLVGVSARPGVMAQ